MADNDLTVFDLLYHLLGKGEQSDQKIANWGENRDEGTDFREILCKKYGIRAVPADPADFAREIVLGELKKVIASNGSYRAYRNTERATATIQETVGGVKV